ncbi:MAG: hypothetical protein KA004_18370 [Verrucomicrobiales bacterium]|nr:hypothetical protein [Verrucomicrobiales bacterium]
MNLTPKQQKELAQFPAVLKALVEAELAAGNSIVEIGGGQASRRRGARRGRALRARRDFRTTA